MAATSVVLRSRFPLVRDQMKEAARRALAATGEKIAERAREAMVPGHFYDTGLSQENTVYEQLSPDEGQVHIATAYAAYPEFGTVDMAPRPVLVPAVEASWPGTMNGYWALAVKGLYRGQQVLPPAPPPGPPMEPVYPDDAVSGGGQP